MKMDTLYEIENTDTEALYNAITIYPIFLKF
jgi:hypothetical protein